MGWVENWFVSKKIYSLFVFVFVLKLILSAVLPLGADEAYYWVWSKNLQLSYFDHPGMVSWLFYLGDEFFRFASASRWPFVILGHLSVFIWIQILKSYLDEKRLFWFTLLFYTSPLIGFGSMVATPDVPLVFFWSLSFFVFLRYLKTPSAFFALLLGAALGLGFCSKYHIVLFLPAAIFYLSSSKQWGRFRLTHVALVVFSGLIFSAPVLIWNFQNEFASFVFQINHGFGRPDWDPFWSYSYPLGQITLLFPVVAYYALLNFSQKKNLPFLYFGFFPILFFFISSFRGVVEMNWPIMAYPAIIALACLSVPRSSFIYGTSLFFASLFAVIVSHLLHPWIPSSAEKLNETFAYEDALIAKKNFSPLFAENYQMSSFIWFKTKQPTYKLYKMSRRDFYDELPQSKPDTDVFYVVMRKTAGLPGWVEEQGYSSEIAEELNEHLLVTKVFKK